MKRYPVVLSIAGSDSSGGAGIQADLKTVSALGVYGATAITAITVQNTVGVWDVHPVPPAFVRGQIEAVMDDLCPETVKIGMINDMSTAKVVSACLRKYHPRYVVFDPVMVSTSGHRLVDADVLSVLTEELIPLVTLLTPNLPEAEVFVGHSVGSRIAMETAAGELLHLGCGAVLLKGGHLKDGEAYDVLRLCGEERVRVFASLRVESRNTHGTGCTLSSAIAAHLALGYSLPDAVEAAKHYVSAAIEAGREVRLGRGNGPLNHFYSPLPMNISDDRR